MQCLHTHASIPRSYDLLAIARSYLTRGFVRDLFSAHAALPTAVLVLEDTHDAAHVSVIAHEPSPGARHDPG